MNVYTVTCVLERTVEADTQVELLRSVAHLREELILIAKKLGLQLTETTILTGG